MSRYEKPAFITQPGQEDDVLDGLGFWDWGAYEGEWSGTSVWLADAPLPDGVIKETVQPLPATVKMVAWAKEQASCGATRAAVLLAPVVGQNGWIVLPVQAANVMVDPNYVAHIASVLPGGEWRVTEPHEFYDPPRPLLVWVVDGVARGMIAPCRDGES